MLTASGVPRALACPASLVLPHAAMESQYADAGSEYHADVEAAIDVGDENAIPEAVLETLAPDDKTITERAYAYDIATDTARELPPAERRAYGRLGAFEIPGTPDLVIDGARMTVVDHKSYEEVEPAERNTQAATYALMLARTHGRDEIDVLIHYRATWRKPSRATLTALDLDAHAARLKQLQLDVVKARANPAAYLNAGPHCKYCPVAQCPQWSALTRQVQTGEIALMIEARIPFADDDEAARAVQLRDDLKLLLARLTGALYARAKDRPIPLPDGKVLAFVEKEGKRKIDGDAAYRVIRERYGSEVADASVRRSVAQKWIEDALKQAGVPKAGAAVKQIVKQLEDAGAVTRDTKEVCEVVPAVKLLKEAG